MGMTNKQAAEFVFDQHAFRVGELFWLAAMNDGESVPDGLRDFIEDGNAQRVFPEIDTDDDCDVPSVAEWLIEHRKLGFVACVHTPVPLSGDPDSYTCAGWGYHANLWIYVETLDELLPRAAEVSKAYIAKVCEQLANGETKKKPKRRAGEVRA